MGPSIPQVEDINNDGNLDIITSNYYCEFYYYEGNETDTFPAMQRFKLEDGTDLTHAEDDWRTQMNNNRTYGALKLHDWNEDGLLDILFMASHVSLTYYENVGSREEPLFKAGEKILMNGEEILFTRPSVEVFDIDLDGNKDLVFGMQSKGSYMLNVGTNSEPVFEESHDLYVYANGDSTKIEMTGVASSVQASPTHGEIQVHVTDWDMDGYPDLLVGENCGWTVDPPFEMLYLFRGIPDGSVAVEEGVLRKSVTSVEMTLSKRELSFSIPAAESGSLSLFSVRGRKIKEIPFDMVSSGIVSLEGISAGSYILQISAGSFVKSSKIVLQ